MIRLSRFPRLLTLLLLFLFPSPALPSPSPTAPSAAELGQLAERIHELVNMERVKHSLPPLDWDVALAQIAWRHSCDMATRHYLGHTTPEGVSPTVRGERDGYFCRHGDGGKAAIGLGENIYQNHLYRAAFRVTIDGHSHETHAAKTLEEIALSTVSGWLGSDGHRHNLLGDAYASAGIGIALAEDGRLYITQLFC